MTPDRWQQISQLFHAALAREGDDRAAFLAEACGGDEPLRRELESLLAQPASAQASFLDAPALSHAAQIVSDVVASALVGRRLFFLFWSSAAKGSRVGHQRGSLSDGAARRRRSHTPEIVPVIIEGPLPFRRRQNWRPCTSTTRSRTSSGGES